jgi:hypothetical protein
MSRMPRPAVFAATLIALISFATQWAEGQAPQTNPDLTYNTYYESLVIPISEEVVAELRFTETQKEKIRKLLPLDASQTSGANYRQDRKKRKDELNKLLTDPQRLRFAELTFQYQGALASFNLPDVAKDLAITPEQKQKLASVQYLLRTGSQNLKAYEQQINRSASNRGKFLVQLRQSCDCVAESVLFPAQMMKWRSMQGKPLVPRPAAWD